MRVLIDDVIYEFKLPCGGQLILACYFAIECCRLAWGLGVAGALFKDQSVNKVEIFRSDDGLTTDRPLGHLTCFNSV